MVVLLSSGRNMILGFNLARASRMHFRLGREGLQREHDMTGYDIEGVTRWVLLERLLSSGNVEQTIQNTSHCLCGLHFMLLGGVLSYADIPQEHRVNTRRNHL